MQTKSLSTSQRRGHQWDHWQLPLLFLALLLLIASGGNIAHSQTQDSLTLGSSTVYYATNNTLAPVVPKLTLTGGADTKINSAKVFLDKNFYPAGERLSLGNNDVTEGSEGVIAWKYDQANGVLTFSGEDTVENYQAALRKVTYTYTNTGAPKPKARTIEISIGNSLFNSDNGHFYEFVKAEDITWTKAKEDAAAKTYAGRQGYLVTVTSADENKFIANKLQGQGWMGATDAGHDKQWKWATGPEADTWFFTQNGYDASGNNTCDAGPTTDQPVGHYSNWANNEPNDAGPQGGCTGNEDYAHFIQVGGTEATLGETGQWNDYPDTTAGLDARYYKVHGYVVEYGDMPGDTPTESLLTGQVTINYVNCHSCGDVHILTPDGLKYDFQSTGDFLATQSSDGKVIVQARQETSPINARVSLNTAVALSVDGDKIEFYVKSDSAYYLNGEAEVLPTGTETLPNQGTIQSIGSESRPQFIITWPDGNFAARVIMYPNSHIDYGVAAGSDSQTTYQGLMGNFDGNAQNDLQVKDGDLIKPPPSLEDLNRFGDSWRVPAEGLLFTVPRAADQAETAHTLVTFEEEARAAAEKTCQEGGISDQAALKNCIYDVAITGDPIFVESAQAFEESVVDLPPSAIVPATVGETLGGAIFAANMANETGITITDGDDLVMTTAKAADGTSHLRLSIYRNGEYIVSFSVGTASADAIAAAMAAIVPQEAQRTLTGQVVDIESGQPLAGGQVCIQNTTQCASVDDAGNYTLSALSSGEQVIEVSAAGYLTAIQSIALVSNETTTQDFALTAEHPVLAVLPDEVVLRGAIVSITEGGANLEENVVESGRRFLFFTGTWNADYPDYKISSGDQTLAVSIDLGSLEGLQVAVLIPNLSETELGKAANAALLDAELTVTTVGDANQPVKPGDLMEVVLTDPTSSNPPYTVNFYRGEGEARQLVATFTIDQQ